MTITNYLRLAAKSWLFLSVTFFIPFSSIAMVNTSNVDATEKQQDTIEIFTVTGQRPIGFFRAQFDAAEDRFFESLNSMVEDDAFKIECKIDANSFSRVAARVCQPNYIDMIIAQLTKDSLDAGSSRKGIQNKIKNLPTRRLVERKIAKKRKEHLKEIETLVSASPALQTALLNLNKAKYSLEKKRIETFGENWVSREAIAAVKQTKEFVDPE